MLTAFAKYDSNERLKETTMETTKLLNEEELESLVKRVWVDSQEKILKQVEYSVAHECGQRAGARARVLIAREVDGILKPKLESMRSAMEIRAQQVADNLLPKLEEAMMSGLKEAIREVSEYLVRQILSQAEGQVRKAMLKALEPEKES